MRLSNWPARTAVVLGLTLWCLPVRAEPLLEKHAPARVAIARGDWVGAKRELRTVLQQDPLDPTAHLLLALVLAQEGHMDEAIVGFQQVLALEPDHATARYNLATAFLRRREPLPAARQLEEALALRPDHVPSYNNLAKAYAMVGLPELAVAASREALRLDPANPVARRNLTLLTAAAEARRSDATDGSRPRPASPAPGGTKVAAVGTGTADAAATPVGAAGMAADPEVEALHDLVRDLPHVMAERRGGRLALTGWTSRPADRKLLDRILVGRTNIVDLTTEDNGNPHRLLEVDATIFKIIGIDSQSVGHNFLRRVEFNASVADGAVAAFDWIYSAAINYEVNIANVSEQRIAFLARPHLTTLSGTPAKFVAGGDVVYQVAGLNSGDIKPYPFGTTLEVTPTLLRTEGEDGSPRVRLSVLAGRRTLLPLQDLDGVPEEGATVFENVSVTSEAVLALNQTLILTGLNQREQRTRRSGVPGLRHIPVIKYLFSERVTSTSDLAIVILLTPRDPAYWDDRNRQETAAFVEKRRAFVEASRGSEEDMRRFKERYPDWGRMAPNRLSAHFFLTENSETYRRASGMDLATEELDFELLGRNRKRK